MLYLIVIGLVSILGQAALLRELIVAFYGIDLIYTLALGVWLIWTALGAMIGRRRLNPSPVALCGLFFLFALFLSTDVVFIRAIRTLFSETPGAYLPFGTQMLAMSLALLPVGLLSGLIFQWAAKSYIAGGRTLASAYAVESAGGLAGGLCATLFLKFGFQNLSIALLCSLFALVAVWRRRGEAGRWLRAATWAGTLLTIALLWQASSIDRAMTAWTHPDLIVSRDTPYGRVTVTQRGGQVAVYENDALSFETEGTEAEEFVDMAALLHPRPARVLILGGGIEGAVREILKHAPTQVDYVELNPALLPLVVPHLPADQQTPLQAASVRITIADARRFLASAGNYDLILIGMPEPASGQANRFYTLEFFQQCAEHLNADGILAFRLKSAENLWTVQQTDRAVSIYRALKAVLPQVQVLPGATNVFAASRRPLPRDPSILVARLEARAITARLVCAPYIRYIYTNDRFARTAQILETGEAPQNSDLHPICYQYTLMIWLSKFYPRLAVLKLSSFASAGWYREPFAWIVALAGIALFIFARGRPSLRRDLWVESAGFVGMCLETLLMLRYQMKSGILFQDIGILLMSFMAGLTAGAWSTSRLIFRNRRMRRWLGPMLMGGFASFSLLIAAWIRVGALDGLAGTAGLLFMAGVLVAAAFAYASFDGVEDQKEAVAPLYAADLLGGCLGSLAASLLLIPMAGMVATAAFMALPGLLCLLLVRMRHVHPQGVT
jgi:spermidine synthase